MTKYFSLLTLLCISTLLTAQTVNPAPDRAADPVQAYPITNQIEGAALQAFAEDFDLQNVGFFHVYADPDVDPKKTYLLRGNPVSSTTKALLPRKYQRIAERMNAKVYGAGEIKGINESYYIVRMDGSSADRIEMFAIRGDKVKHLKTLAYRECTTGRCAQLDTYITDLDGDTNLDLIQMKRVRSRNGEKTWKPRAYVMNERNGKWKKTKALDLPLDSMKFFDERNDNK